MRQNQEIIIKAPALLDPHANLYSYEPFQSEVHKFQPDSLQTTILCGLLTAVVRHCSQIQQICDRRSESNSALEKIFSDPTFTKFDKYVQWPKIKTTVNMEIRRQSSISNIDIGDQLNNLQLLCLTLNETYPRIFNYIKEISEFYTVTGSRDKRYDTRRDIPSYPQWIQQYQTYQVETQQAGIPAATIWKITKTPLPGE